jgi:hypothetical protein
MPVDDKAIEAIRGLIEERKGRLGEKTFKLASVRKAMAVLAPNLKSGETSPKTHELTSLDCA